MARSQKAAAEGHPLVAQLKSGAPGATQVYGGTRMNGTVGAGCDLPYSQSCNHAPG